MSTMEQAEGLHTVGQTMSSENLHPRAVEGVSLPEEFQFDTKIWSIDSKDTSRDRYGSTVTNYRLRMNDKSMYNLRVTKPLDPDTDIAVYKTPAWSTNSHGHNERTGHELGNLGLPNVEVSALGEERDSLLRELARFAMNPLKTFRDLQNVSLAREAHVMLSVAKEGDYFGLNNEYALWFGESRGAMTLMGACAMAASHDIKIPFAMAVAPCFKVGLGRDTYNEHKGQIGRELVNMAGMVGHVSLGRLIHYPNTLNPSPKSIVYEIAHAPTLFRGDAGKLAEHIPLDQNMLVLAFENDLAGQFEKWEEHFEPYPNTVVRPVPGAHLSIADKRTMDFVTHNFDNITQQLRYGVPVNELNYSHAKRALRLVDDSEDS